MEAVPIGSEEQPEEQEENQQPEVLDVSGATEETVASTDCIESEKMDETDGSTGQEEEATPSGGPTGMKPPPTPPPPPPQSTGQEEDQIVEIDSSPEKMPPTQAGNDPKTKDAAVDLLYSPPEQDVFTVDDEEEHDGEEEADQEELDDDDAYDDEDEIYVEEKDSTVLNDSFTEEKMEEDEDEPRPLDISTDEYTDEEEEEEGRTRKRDMKPSAKRKASSDLEDDDEVNEDDDDDEEEEEDDDDDDDDVQIVTDDEDEVVEEYDDDEDEMVEMSSSPEKSAGGEVVVVRKFSSGSSSHSGGSGNSSSEERSPRLKVKYRTYQRKQAATLRKRALRILNKQSMHGMEDGGDALGVCSMQNLSTNLKPFIALPRVQTHEQELELRSLKVHKLPSTSVLPKESEPQDDSLYVTTTTISGASLTKETKEPAGDDHAEAKPADDGTATVKAADTVEKSSNAITSTTPSSTVAAGEAAATDTMPTATAVEVSEKIADSSDDAVSMLSMASSAKKSVTAITPTVNSSASTEPAAGQKSETEESVTAKASSKETSEEVVEKQENETTISQEPSVEDGKRTKSPEAAEPTADDVMAGIDDILDQNGSEEGDEGKTAEKDFNEDLTFQMDVDEEPVGVKSPGQTKTPPPPPSSLSDKVGASAIDLTSATEPKSKPASPVAALNESTATQNERRSSTNASAAPAPVKESDVDMHDKTVVTSTPVTDQKKAHQKRTERVESQDAASSSLEVEDVKREREDAEDTGGGGGQPQAQNLSKQKPVRDGADSLNLARKTANASEPTNRKRRRSVESEEERRAGVEQDEPAMEPAKKLKLEVEAHYQTHDRVVNEYIETTQNTSVDEIQSHTDVLVKDLQTLTDMIRETELQWNNLIHLKKVKEEILLRLNRRKHVIGITDTRLGESSVYSDMDSSNLTNQHHHQHHHHHHQQPGRSSSVGPRPPTPPPEVEIRPASVTNSSMQHYGGHGSSTSATTNGNAMISNRRSSAQTAGTGGKRSAKEDTNRFVSQFNSSNNAVTMVPLSSSSTTSTTSMLLNARASMNADEVEKDRALAQQIQRHILPKPVLSNHQQILNNLAMSAGLTAGGGTGGRGGSTTTVGDLLRQAQELHAATTSTNTTNLFAGIASQALLNGHHNPGGSNSSSVGSTSHQQQQQQQLQIGRQGMRKDVSSIIADYRQKHPENVPRRGRRLKNVGGGSSSSSNGGTATFGEGGAISLTALSGGKSPGNARSNSTDSVANRISEFLAAAETSRPSSNDSSQSSSNLLLSSLVSGASGAPSNGGQQFLKDVLAQFAKMSQNEQSLLSNLQLLSNNATTATNTVSSPQQSPHHQQHQAGSGALHQQQSSSALLFSKASLPEVTLHPVMNSTAHSDVLGGGGNGSLANLSAVNSSTNSLLHGILTKSASRPGSASAAAAAANSNTFSPTLARLLTGPERMNSQASSSSTVTSGALANLQTNSATGGLNLSKNVNEISITPVVGSNFQQTLLAQQQQQQLQRLRDQHLFKGESYLNLDDEADDSVDRLVIDEGDDMMGHGSKRRGAEINENEVPQCQGCKKQEAKFVCAGCGNQWYCSRVCQVNAWDDHSEVCSG